MYIEKVDLNHLKVELSGDDMQSLEMNCTSFTYQNEHSRTILKAILRKANEQTGFPCTNCRMMIEVFPASDNGCMLLFTKITPEKRVKLKLISSKKGMTFEFKKLDDLLQAVSPLIAVGIPEENSLYYMYERYFLHINANVCNKKALFLVLSEFAERKHGLSKQYLNEYAVLICDENAVKNLTIVA